MKCSEVQALLIDLLYEELSAEDQSQLLKHLETCVGCQETWNQLHALSAAADRWVAPMPSRGIAERALARVTSEQVREAAREASSLSPAFIFTRILLAVGAASLSLLLIAGAVGQGVGPLTVGVMGVLWTGLYAGLLLMAPREQMRPVVWSALGGASIALLLVPLLSIPSVAEACARLVQAAPGSALFALILALAAAGYTAGPLLLGGILFGRPREDRGRADGLRLAALYALLIAPAVYLQCVELSLPVTAMWMAGALLGAGVAGPAAVRLARLRAVSNYN